MYESRSEMTGTMFDSVHVMVYSSNPERTSPPAGYVTRTSAATTPKKHESKDTEHHDPQLSDRNTLNLLSSGSEVP